MNEKKANRLEKKMIKRGAVVIPNGTTISDWLVEGDVHTDGIDELMLLWHEDFEDIAWVDTRTTSPQRCRERPGKLTRPTGQRRLKC